MPLIKTINMPVKVVRKLVSGEFWTRGSAGFEYKPKHDGRVGIQTVTKSGRDQFWYFAANDCREAAAFFNEMADILDSQKEAK